MQVQSYVLEYSANVFGYKGPSNVVISPFNSPLTGGSRATVKGMNFGLAGYTQSARGGGTTCAYTEWISDSVVHCSVAGGVGRTKPIAITVGLGVESISMALSYDVPTMTGASNSPSKGELLTVLGSGFGQWDVSQGMRLGGSACEATVWMSSSAVSCDAATG